MLNGGWRLCRYLCVFNLPTCPGAPWILAIFSMGSGSLRASRLAAVFTDPVNLKGMTSGVKMIPAANFLFQLSYFRRKEFDRSPAIGTHHMMMAAAVELVLVAGHSVMKSHLAGQATFRQQLQSSVDGGKSDLWVLLPRQAKKLIGGKMITGLQEGAEDGIPLVGMLQADTPQ